MLKCGSQPHAASSGIVAESPTRYVAFSHNGRMAGEIRPDRLRALREERGEDLHEAAAGSGVNRSHLNKMELGQKQPSLASLDALSRYYNVSPDYLLGWSDERLPGQGGQPLESGDERAFLTAYRMLPSEIRSGVVSIVMGVRQTATPKAVPRKRDNPT